MTEIEREVLRELEAVERTGGGPHGDRWARPMDVGGHDGSGHSTVLARFAKAGLAERQRRGTLVNVLGGSRGSWLYAITDAGRAALDHENSIKGRAKP